MNLFLALDFVYAFSNKKTLGNDIIPLHYDLHFKITPERFEGQSRISVKANNKVKKVTLNAEDLEIQSITLLDNSEEFVGTFYPSKDAVDVFFESPLFPEKEYTLLIKYQGKYSEGMDGIYKSSYNGKPLYSTHFEATSARKAFPCFDQPDLKATFDIKITAPEDHTVLSNSSLSKKEGNKFYFNVTKPMSTYLVAFAVGKLEYIQASSKNGVPIRVYGDKSDIKDGALALEVAKHTLDFFEKYFNIQYPFPKLDLIAIPEFAMGAMENWGLVTFRKTSLLYNPNTDATASKLIVVETVCHELAHMWFGNLVTMNWWNDLWLNEGFATWASTMAVYNLPKELIDFDIWLNFINMTLEEGMEYDGLHSTHPIAVEVNNPDEINQIFDSISYNKGASLIRMIENFIGHESFRKGIQKYMEHFKYLNAESDDFFAFQDNPDLTTRMAASWLNQEGFPLITVKERNNELVISQTRFLSGTKNKDDKLWIIPITVQFEDQPPTTYLLDQKSITIPMEKSIYKLNVSNVGFYRVQYTQEAFTRIFKYYSKDKERLNIINDLFALAFGGYVKIKWVVGFFKDTSIEYDYESLKSILANFRKLCQIYYEEPEKLLQIQNIMAALLKKYIENFDLEKEGKTISMKLLNAQVLSNAVYIGNSEITKKLKDYYENFKSGKGHICPDYTYAMLSSVVDDHLDEVINLAKTSKLSNIKIMAMKALGAVKNPENIRRVLDMYKELDRQDLSYYYSGLASNLKYRNMVIGYFINNFEKIRNHASNESILNSSMSHVFCGISNFQLVANIADFVSDMKSNRTVRKIIENNQIYSEFRKANNEII